MPANLRSSDMGGGRLATDRSLASKLDLRAPAEVSAGSVSTGGFHALAGRTSDDTARARLEEHRSNAVCAACHTMMDPIGFALENFDALGAWRWNDSGFPVDASGQLVDGTKVDGPASLREALVGHSDAFLRTFTEKLLTYALGRGIEYYDMPVVRAIDCEAARNDNRFSSFILAIVRSTPFRMRRAEEKD